MKKERTMDKGKKKFMLSSLYIYNPLVEGFQITLVK